MQVLPVEAGGTVAIPMHAVSSIQHFHLEASVTNGAGLPPDMAPRVFDLHHLMWGQPSTKGRRFVVLINESDLTFGLVVNRVQTARSLEQLHPLPDTFLKAGQLFQGLIQLDGSLVPVLYIEKLSAMLLSALENPGDDTDRSN